MAGGGASVTGLLRAIPGDPAALDQYLRGCDAAIINSSVDGVTPLTHSIAHPKALKLLLAHGAQPNFVSPQLTQTALHLASEANAAESVRLLLSAGARTDIEDELGQTPLHRAACVGAVEAAKALVIGGADVNRRTRGGSTPLLLAVRADSLGVVGVLVNAGADPNAPSGDGLRCAATASATLLTALAAARADLTHTDATGASLLLLAVKRGDAAVASALLRLCPALVELPDAAGFTPLHAASTRSVALTRMLVHAGAPLNARTRMQRTAAHLAAAKDAVEVLALLADAGALIDDEDANACTPLMLAAGLGSTRAVTLLASRGVCLNVRTPDEGLSALSVAIRNAHTDTALALIAAGAQVDLASEDGSTPLAMAARFGQTETVKALVAAKADLTRRSKSGLNALHVAVHEGHIEVVRTLMATAMEQVKAMVNHTNSAGLTPLCAAVRAKHADLIPLLLSLGALVNARTPDLRTPLHFAAESEQNLPMLPTLLTAGANVNAADGTGDTPLIAAVSSGSLKLVQVLLGTGAATVRTLSAALIFAISSRDNPDLVRLLIDAGADVNASDARSFRPLYHTRSAVVARMLLEAKADPNVGDSDGLTPLMYAAMYGPLAKLDALLHYGARVDQAAHCGRTALLFAAQHGQVAALRSVIAHKASLTVAVRGGWNCLHAACLHPGALELLLAHRPGDLDANAPSADGSTPLRLAAAAGCVASVVALLGAGASPSIGEPLRVAAEKGHALAAEVLTQAMRGPERIP